MLTKSAQFPFHFWLPHAMAAPTPVSAYLHSAAMVKAGVFLLARLWPALAGTELWFWTVSSAGAASLLLGAISATFQRDMKGVLAYSTISHLGLITLLLGMNTRLALVAAVFHMMNHATFKASLFMAAGIVDHETGTRDLSRLSGLRHAHADHRDRRDGRGGGDGGRPAAERVPLQGDVLRGVDRGGQTRAACGSRCRSWRRSRASSASRTRCASSTRCSSARRPQDLPRQPHEPTRGMLLPSALLVLACLLVGMLPGQTIGPPLAMAVHAILGDDVPPYALAAWHGLTRPLVMSLVALGRRRRVLPDPVLPRPRDGAHARCCRRLNARRTYDIINVSVIRGAGAADAGVLLLAPAGAAAS